MDDKSRIQELSDEDLDAQLNAYNDNLEGVMTGKQTGKTASGGFRANVNDVIAQAFQRIEKISERDETVDAAVKAAVHGVKRSRPIPKPPASTGPLPSKQTH